MTAGGEGRMDWPGYFDGCTLPFRLERGATALMPIDLQYASASRHEGFGRVLADQGRAAEAEYRFSRIERLVVPNTRRLIELFRRCRAPVIHVTLGCEQPDYSDAPPHMRRLFQLVGNVKGTRTHEILDELKPQGDELVVLKRTQGAFASSGIEAILRAKGIRQIVMTGVSTNMCVDATARGASDRGFGTVMVSDATGTCSDAMQQASMLTFGRLWGRVLSTDEVIVEMEEAYPVR
jgi:nicotinamidase-related amidase